MIYRTMSRVMRKALSILVPLQGSGAAKWKKATHGVSSKSQTNKGSFFPSAHPSDVAHKDPTPPSLPFFFFLFSSAFALELFHVFPVEVLIMDFGFLVTKR